MRKTQYLQAYARCLHAHVKGPLMTAFRQGEAPAMPQLHSEGWSLPSRFMTARSTAQPEASPHLPVIKQSFLIHQGLVGPNFPTKIGEEPNFEAFHQSAAADGSRGIFCAPGDYSEIFTAKEHRAHKESFPEFMSSRYEFLR